MRILIPISKCHTRRVTEPKSVLYYPALLPSRHSLFWLNYKGVREQHQTMPHS